jgi:hypothetical protein
MLLLLVVGSAAIGATMAGGGCGLCVSMEKPADRRVRDGEHENLNCSSFKALLSALNKLNQILY